MGPASVDVWPYGEPNGRFGHHRSQVGSSTEPTAVAPGRNGTAKRPIRQNTCSGVMIPRSIRSEGQRSSDPKTAPVASYGSAPLRPNTGCDSATSAAQAAQHAAVRERREIKNQVLSRTSTASLVGRASSMRRQRRRVMHTTRPYCRTNGCASFLEVDPTTGRASCPICGYVLPAPLSRHTASRGQAPRPTERLPAP